MEGGATTAGAGLGLQHVWFGPRLLTARRLGYRWLGLLGPGTLDVGRIVRR